MSRTIRRTAAAGTLLMALFTLAACGGSGSAPAVRVSPAPSSAAASAAPSPSAVAADATTSAASAAALTGRYAGIQQSQTAEGYYMLGDPAAPVVLMHYSDFL